MVALVTASIVCRERLGGEGVRSKRWDACSAKDGDQEGVRSKLEKVHLYAGVRDVRVTRKAGVHLYAGEQQKSVIQ